MAERTSCDPGSLMAQGLEKCPFLRSLSKTPSFNCGDNGELSFTPSGSAGPIFVDGPSFDEAFRLFHGRNGVVPLSKKPLPISSAAVSSVPASTPAVKNHHPPNVASAATISLSAFGPLGPYSFDSFVASRGDDLAKPSGDKEGDRVKEKKLDQEPQKNEVAQHEALGSQWLAEGQCPIAKTYRAVHAVLPLVAAAMKPPANMKIRCPPAIVAARAALAKTPAVRALRPQPLSTKVLTIGGLGIAVNVPLGVWREHTEKFSPQWFLAVHASIPLIAMARKAVVMPKYAIAFTILSAMIGQYIGSRLERRRMAGSVHPDSGLWPLTIKTIAKEKSQGQTSTRFQHENMQHACRTEANWTHVPSQKSVISAC